MEAILQGTYRHPQILVHFGWGETLSSGRPVQDWVKGLPGRVFDRGNKTWTITGLGPDPQAVLDRAGVTLDYGRIGPDSDLYGRTLAELVDPICMLKKGGRRVLVRHRLLGYDLAVERLGQGATWDKVSGRFELPVTDVLLGGSPRPGIIHDQRAIDRAYEVRALPLTRPEDAAVVAAAGSAASMDDLTAEQIAHLRSINGVVPAWFGLPMYPFQEVGALAVAAGHTGLFDEPRVGKTRTSLAAATLLRSHRTLIISPPLVVTNWARNAEESQLATRGGKTDGKVAVFRSGRKEPELPTTGIVIVSDSLIAARPDLRQRLMDWSPQVTILDEAHRESTYGAKRTEAVLELGHATEKRAIALTGTPLFSSPAELVPLLELTGHLGPVFGSVDEYLTTYTKLDRFGRNLPKKRDLPQLQALLREHVWVRRSKKQVGIGKPFTHDPEVVDVDLKPFREAHQEVLDRVEDWLDQFVADHDRKPNDEEMAEFASESIGFISILRKAAGMAKLPAAVQMVKDHVQSTTTYVDGKPIYNRPLIVWTHHREVSEAMAGALGDEVAESAMIIGGMSMTAKDEVVDRFQRGEIPVIACSIIAAGVGIDLTRSSDVMFVETDWTPANVQQALDRVQGVNQKANVTAYTLIAPGTLDERLQKVQHTKGQTLSAVLGGDHDVSVAENIDEMRALSDILFDLVAGVVKKKRLPRKV